MISLAIHNTTSSPASADGLSLSASPDGLTVAQCELAPAPANPSASQGECWRKKIIATSGRYSVTLSPSASLQKRLESRLRARLDYNGSKPSRKIWKAVVTPSQRRFCQLALTVRDMSASESSGLPTPAARDGKDLSSTTAYLASRARHSPSLATRLLALGANWKQVASAYCLAMGYPLAWLDAHSKASATPSSPKSGLLS